MNNPICTCGTLKRVIQGRGTCATVCDHCDGLAPDPMADHKLMLAWMVKCRAIYRLEVATAAVEF